MTAKPKNKLIQVIQEKNYLRFTLGQRWEHLVLIISFTVLLLTGLPQKYREFSWSQDLLSTPERLAFIQQIHHLAAILLAFEALYHLGRAIYLLARRKLPGYILPVWQDVIDAGQMVQYLLFLRKDKPKFGKYNFEQKVTYWFIFFAVLIMGITGVIIWFPTLFTRFLPGEMVPAAKLAHSTEAVVAAIFIVIWHIYHVHLERLNLSIFTGKLSEKEMREYHAKDYERLERKITEKAQPGEKQ
jgi:formate dehydrogenase gamma subunit